MIPARPRTSAPYAHDRGSVRRTMFLVLAALTPATAFGLYQFGWPAIYLFALTAVAAVVVEALCLLMARRPLRPFLTDGSALLTGWLLALSLPPWAPWWIGVLGAAIAIVLGKHVFGGLGQNVFNPAMVARVALLISFPLEMTAFTAPLPLASPGAHGAFDALAVTFGLGGAAPVDAVSSASILAHVKAELTRGVAVDQSLLWGLDQLMLGAVPGSMGETSGVLLLIGGLFLIQRRVISWHIPVAMLGTLAALATVFHLIDPARHADALVHLTSGAAILGAFFIATDLVTSPVTPRGQLIFGAGCGALVFIIRSWAGYPEGVAFAVLLMNALTPLIDRYVRPRVYGRTPKGEPLKAGRGGG